MLYYVTVGTGDSFLRNFSYLSILSLIKAGVDPGRIYCVVRNKKDKSLISKLLPQIEDNVYIQNEDLSYVESWGKRKYSLFKAAALFKKFPKPKDGQSMVYFDGDVLWYNNPDEFLETKVSSTWFHHGKELANRSKKKKKDINVRKYDSLKQWISPPCAYLMVKHNAKRLPDREAVAGFYILHPNDHEVLLKTTYKLCKELSKKFHSHIDVGDQKPMNAALNILDIQWDGGLRFDCPEHIPFFEHFMGVKSRKLEFQKMALGLGLIGKNHSDYEKIKNFSIKRYTKNMIAKSKDKEIIGKIKKYYVHVDEFLSNFFGTSDY